MRRENSFASALALGLIVMALVSRCYCQLKIGFYNGKCGNVNVEEVIFRVVKRSFDKDPTLVAAMLRMQFHDCFVRGCDASLLLDGRKSEKTALPNLSVRGYELVHEAKAAVEEICPKIVSCADIIIIVTRVTVFLAKGNWYKVETGRRDGRISRREDANALLPQPNVAVGVAVRAFGALGLSTEDFVILMGGHTVGVAKCGLFQDRMYNFRGTPGRSDSSINPSFLPTLKNTCPRNNRHGNSFASLDQVSPLTIDNGYYVSLLARRGILQTDQDLAFNPLTSKIVARLALNGREFRSKFGPVMVKLGRVGVLTGKQGEIRRSCRFVNRHR